MGAIRIQPLQVVLGVNFDSYPERAGLRWESDDPSDVTLLEPRAGSTCVANLSGAATALVTVKDGDGIIIAQMDVSWDPETGDLVCAPHAIEITP